MNSQFHWNFALNHNDAPEMPPVQGELASMPYGPKMRQGDRLTSPQVASPYGARFLSLRCRERRWIPNRRAASEMFPPQSARMR